MLKSVGGKVVFEILIIVELNLSTSIGNPAIPLPREFFKNGCNGFMES